MNKKTLGFLVGSSMLVLIAVIASMAGPSGYHLIKTIHIGGDGGWDYLTVDAVNRKLYVSHSTHVVVIDIDKNEVVGDIPDTKGVHGIAIANDLNRGFTSNGQANNVTIFDLKTFKVLGTASAGQNPDAIIYDPFSKRVFTFNGRSSDVTAIDAATGETVGTLPVGGKPEFAASNGKGKVFVNIEDKSEVIAFDPKKMTIITRWPLAPGGGPSGMAIDVAHNRIFSGCGDGSLMVISDTEAGKVIGSVPIGAGVDANAFDPGTQLAFSSNGRAATLTVAHEDSPNKFTVVEDVPTHAGARTMALDTKTHNVYLAIAEYGPPPPAPAGGGRPPRPQPIKDSFAILVYGK